MVPTKYKQTTKEITKMDTSIDPTIIEQAQTRATFIREPIYIIELKRGGIFVGTWAEMYSRHLNDSMMLIAIRYPVSRKEAQAELVGTLLAFLSRPISSLI